MTEHAALGASSCYRWWPCPGSARLAATAPPSPPSRFALEGTAAHAVLAWALGERSGFRAASEAVGRPVSAFVTDARDLADMATVGIDEIDEEMAEGAQVHIDYVTRHLTHSTLLLVEHRVDLTPLNPPAPMFGTADTILFDTATGLLETVDFKYGRGVFVAAEGNPQLRYYGLGAWLDAQAKKRPVKLVKNTIVQPRCGGEPIRSETLDPMDLYDWHAELMEAAARTTDPAAPLVAGDWCGFCPAFAICPAARAAALEVARVDFTALPTVTVPTPEEMTPAELVRVLDGLDLLDGWANAVRAHAKARLDRGETLPGWRLGERVGHRKWKGASDLKENKDLALALTTTLTDFGVKGDDLFQPRELKSPAQMEKLLTKKQRESAEFKALWHKPVTGTTMVRTESAAAPVQPKISQDFSAVPAGAVPSDQEESLL